MMLLMSMSHLQTMRCVMANVMLIALMTVMMCAMLMLM